MITLELLNLNFGSFENIAKNGSDRVINVQPSRACAGPLDLNQYIFLKLAKRHTRVREYALL